MLAFRSGKPLTIGQRVALLAIQAGEPAGEAEGQSGHQQQDEGADETGIQVPFQGGVDEEGHGLGPPLQIASEEDGGPKFAQGSCPTEEQTGR